MHLYGTGISIPGKQSRVMIGTANVLATTEAEGTHISFVVPALEYGHYLLNVHVGD